MHCVAVRDVTAPGYRRGQRGRFVAAVLGAAPSPPGRRHKITRDKRCAQDWREGPSAREDRAIGEAPLNGLATRSLRGGLPRREPAEKASKSRFFCTLAQRFLNVLPVKKKRQRPNGPPCLLVTRETRENHFSRNFVRDRRCSIPLLHGNLAGSISCKPRVRAENNLTSDSPFHSI